MPQAESITYEATIRIFSVMTTGEKHRFVLWFAMACICLRYTEIPPKTGGRAGQANCGDFPLVSCRMAGAGKFCDVLAKETI